MPLPPHLEDPLSLFDVLSGFQEDAEFATNFDFIGTEFGADFTFEDAFDFDSIGSGAFEYDNISCESSVERMLWLRRRNRRKRQNNRVFCKENVKKSCWYRYFTRPGLTREITHNLSSSDCFGEFRQWFCMSLGKVEELTTILINREYIRRPRSHRLRKVFRERSELLVMSALYLLATGATFCCCKPLCGICTLEVRKFFYIFIEALVDMKDEYIYIPRNITEMQRISRDYNAAGLPGCVGSMDVVHVKWANCPTGDHNRAKGKEGYPTLAFQCLTDFNRRIMAIYGPQFGSRNDKDIVKHDDNVRAIRFNRLFTNSMWKYYDACGNVQSERGMYLICDNGYLRWPTSICPYSKADNSTLEGYFSTNLESVRKDVECTFGILKKKWKVLNHGFKHREMEQCEKIFIACCILHNFLLDQMVRNSVRVGHGYPIGDDGLWLDGNTVNVDTNASEKFLSTQFGSRRSLLAKHLHVF